jgi:hypothetical protein
MVIHWQNSYALPSRRCTGCRETQSLEQVNKVKKILPVFTENYKVIAVLVDTR